MATVAALALLLGLTAGATAHPTSSETRRFSLAGPDGEALPFTSEDEVLRFLGSARVVSETEIASGINRPLKLLLEDGGIRMHGIFRSVDKREGQYRLSQRVIVRFRDSWAFEVAAYRLDRMLGLEAVPPTVVREIDRRRGSVQAWIESAMTETDRRRKEPGERSDPAWVRQWQRARIFDVLIDNFDRNLGNVLIDRQWKVWLIDHTRSFTIHGEFRDPQRIFLCDRDLWHRLQTLDEKDLKAQLGDLLNERQIDALMVRRNLLVKHFEQLIAERGAAAVLFERDVPPPIQPVELQ